VRLTHLATLEEITLFFLSPRPGPPSYDLGREALSALDNGCARGD
jgi:hypothetical protein